MMRKKNKKDFKKIPGASSAKRKSLPLIRGRFSASASGFGFVTPLAPSTKKERGVSADALQQDVFIPPKYTAGAIDGDLVELEILPDSDDAHFAPKRDLGPVGKIVSVLEHRRSTIVAALKGRHYARPLDKRLPEEIKLVDLPRAVRRGEWVRLRLQDQEGKEGTKLRGAVEDHFGVAGDVEADLRAIEAEFNLPPPYSDELNRAAMKIEAQDIERTDLRSLFTVTIDPADAHDFDDAVSIMPGEKRTELQLGVHISDVAAFIRPGTKFDKEAYFRSFSSYIPGMFRPMLPKPLTAKISLREGVDSIAHSVLFTVRKADGKILSAKRVHSLVHIQRRLSFTEVQAFIENPKSAPSDWDKTFKKNLSMLVELTAKMRAFRKKTEEFLALELPEIRVVCDEVSKKVTGLERKVQGEADQLIEECMLAANSAVAVELIERQIPGLYRIHPEPDPAKIMDFSAFLEKTFQFKTGDILSSRAACTKFIDSIPSDHRRPIIISHFLRSLPRAAYLAEPAEHFGLGKMKYAHFTSPIRRYPDLALHQQLWNADSNGRLKSKRKLAEIAEECSLKEENNDNAFYAANDRMKLHYLRDNGALENAVLYEGVISKISSAGLVCDIAELGLYGFVPSANLRGGAFRRSARKDRMKAERGHTEYKIGDFIYLSIDSIDLVRGTALFKPSL